MAIETLDDWNAILGQCCCEMPSCPLPTRECESIELPLCGHLLPEHPDVPEGCQRYTTKTVTFSYTLTGTFPNDPPPDDEWSSTINSTAQTVIDLVRGAGDAPECRTRYGQSRTDTENYHYYGVEAIFSGTWVYESPIGTWEPFLYGTPQAVVINANLTYNTSLEYPPDPPETDSGSEVVFAGFNDADPDETWTFIAPATFTKTVSVDGELEDTTSTYIVTYSGEPEDPFVEFTFPDDANGESCTALRTCLAVSKTRFRWVIPQDWGDIPAPGSYFKITWDLVFFPDDEGEDPAFVATDETWEWTGPGDPEDADSWKSDWNEIDPPEIAGEVRVVNIRYECYRPTSFGIKPQITGEAYEAPPP